MNQVWQVNGVMTKAVTTMTNPKTSGKGLSTADNPGGHYKTRMLPSNVLINYKPPATDSTFKPVTGEHYWPLVQRYGVDIPRGVRQPLLRPAPIVILAGFGVTAVQVDIPFVIQPTGNAIH